MEDARGVILAKVPADTEFVSALKTVEWHRSNLMAKLDVHSVAELVRYALDNNLVGNNAGDGSNKPIDRL